MCRCREVSDFPEDSPVYEVMDRDSDVPFHLLSEDEVIKYIGLHFWWKEVQFIPVGSEVYHWKLGTIGNWELGTIRRVQ